MATQNVSGNKPEKLSPDSKPLCFLDLPGELRNRVYKEIIPHQPMRLRRTPRPEPGFYLHLALANANKQIEAEFRPLYMEHMRVEVCWNDFLAYRETFFEMVPEGPKPRDLIINLHPDDCGDSVDVLPFIKLTGNPRNLKCRFQPDPRLKGNSPYDREFDRTSYHSIILEDIFAYFYRHTQDALHAELFHRVVLHKLSRDKPVHLVLSKPPSAMTCAERKAVVAFCDGVERFFRVSIYVEGNPEKKWTKWTWLMMEDGESAT